MNFKEAIIAMFNGEKVTCNNLGKNRYSSNVFLYAYWDDVKYFRLVTYRTNGKKVDSLFSFEYEEELFDTNWEIFTEERIPKFMEELAEQDKEFINSYKDAIKTAEQNLVDYNKRIKVFENSLADVDNFKIKFSEEIRKNECITK